MKTKAIEFVRTNNDIVSVDANQNCRVISHHNEWLSVTDNGFDWTTAKIAKDAKLAKESLKLGIMPVLTDAKPEQGEVSRVTTFQAFIDAQTLRRAELFGEVNHTAFYANAMFVSAEGDIVVSNALSLYHGRADCVTGDVGAMIPNVLVRAIVSALSKKSVQLVHFNVCGERVEVRLEGLVFESRLIAGDYPQYQPAVPQKCVESVTFDVSKGAQVLVKAKDKQVFDTGVALYHIDNLKPLIELNGRDEITLQIESRIRPAKLVMSNGDYAIVVPSRF